MPFELLLPFKFVLITKELKKCNLKISALATIKYC